MCTTKKERISKFYFDRLSSINSLSTFKCEIELKTHVPAYHWLCLKTAKFRLRTLLFGVLFRVSDDDAKENGEKAIGLDWQNNNFACA